MEVYKMIESVGSVEILQNKMGVGLESYAKYQQSISISFTFSDRPARKILGTSF